MVIEKARDLGIALSESPEFKRMLMARAAIEENEEIMNNINMVHEKQRLVGDLLAEGAIGETRIDIATLTHEIEDIQTELMASEPFQEVLESQRAFESLMQRVNKIIATCIGADFGGESASDDCGGNCSGCSGCKH